MLILLLYTSAIPDNGRTWLFLINGGEKSFEEEKVARDELKKIYQCFVSNKLVKPEHVVCATGGKGKLFQHETIINVSKLSSVFPQVSAPPTTQSIPVKRTGKKTATTGGGFNLVGILSYHLKIYGNYRIAGNF